MSKSLICLKGANKEMKAPGTPHLPPLLSCFVSYTNTISLGKQSQIQTQKINKIAQKGISVRNKLPQLAELISKIV